MAAKTEQGMVVAAWNEYRRLTRNAIGFKYDEIEPWAWAKLQKDLSIIKKVAKKKVYAHA